MMRRSGRCALNIRAGESIEQFAFRHSNAANCVEIVHAVRCFVIKQTIPAAEPVRAQLSLEVVDFALVLARVSFARQMFEPERIQLQSAQTKHPLQWH